MNTPENDSQPSAPPAPEAPLAPVPEDPIATAEYWAEKLGYLPRMLAPSGEFVRPNPKYQDFAQAKAHGNWPEGKELTQAEFIKAIAAAKDPKTHIFR